MIIIIINISNELLYSFRQTTKMKLQNIYWRFEGIKT